MNARTVVFLNRLYLNGASVQYQRSVALHELGHQMGLYHSLQFIQFPLAVMWRFAGEVTYYQDPQQDDVCGVRAIYRSNTYPVSVPPCHSDHSIPP